MVVAVAVAVVGIDSRIVVGDCGVGSVISSSPHADNHTAATPIVDSASAGAPRSSFLAFPDLRLMTPS